MSTFSWMAWTWPVAIFFGLIAFGLIGLTILEARNPAIERRGILGIRTTRGDRFFVSLLGSAYVHLGWLGLTDLPLWWASIVSLCFAALIFRKA